MIRNQKGMTLVEILIVVTIVASMTAMFAIGASNYLKKANIKNAKVLIGEYMKAIDTYNLDCGKYPSAENGLKSLMEATSDCKNWGPEPYLKKLIQDPWKNDIIYESDGKGYVLKSLGADGKEGGTGGDADITSDDLE